MSYYAAAVSGRDWKMWLLSDLLLGVVRSLVFVYDVFTFPVYRAILEQPWEGRTKQNLGPVRFIFTASIAFYQSKVVLVLVLFRHLLRL